jgi:hypothetical protein
MMAVVSWQLAQVPTALSGMTELAEALGSIIIHTSPIWNGPGANGQGLCEFTFPNGH